MNCQLGNHEAYHIVSLNIQSRGLFFACVPCAREHGYFCDRHGVGHYEYPPDGTTCPICVNETAERNRGRGKKFLQQIYEALPVEVYLDLNDYFDTGNEPPNLAWRAHRLITELSLRACCRHVPLSVIVKEICRTKSIRPIFP